MRRRLLRWLVCPACYGKLDLLVAESENRKVSQIEYAVLDATAKVQAQDEIDVEIVSGALTCKQCSVYYPIHNGIPRMLTYPTRVAEIHLQQNTGWVREHLAGFDLPGAVAPPGEERVLRNFSKEWTDYAWDGTHYWDTTPDLVLKAIRYSLGVPRQTLKHRLILEVGIGIGGTADALCRTEECELIGMDLGYAVDHARQYFGKNARLHIVQASVFAPPFQSGTFDVVYSHGVIHHTHSTEAAFRVLAQLPKTRSGMLYIWVYSHEQEQETPLRRILMATERVVRPALSRLPVSAQTLFLLPSLPFYLLYQNLYRRNRLERNYAAKYGWNEALHAARDRLTPPFAHRHTYDEVINWFKSEMYQNIETLRDEPLPDGIPETYGLNVGVRGFRNQANL